MNENRYKAFKEWKELKLPKLKAALTLFKETGKFQAEWEKFDRTEAFLLIVEKYANILRADDDYIYKWVKQQSEPNPPPCDLYNKALSCAFTKRYCYLLLSKSERRMLSIRDVIE